MFLNKNALNDASENSFLPFLDQEFSPIE